MANSEIKVIRIKEWAYEQDTVKGTKEWVEVTDNIILTGQEINKEQYKSQQQ